jgi:hypothetical protein
VTFPEQIEARETVHLRHRDIEQDQVWICPADKWQHLAADCRFGDDLEVVAFIKCKLNRVEHQTMIIRDQDFKGPHWPQGLPLFVVAWLRLSFLPRPLPGVACEASRVLAFGSIGHMTYS